MTGVRRRVATPKRRERVVLWIYGASLGGASFLGSPEVARRVGRAGMAPLLSSVPCAVVGEREHVGGQLGMPGMARQNGRVTGRDTPVT